MNYFFSTSRFYFHVYVCNIICFYVFFELNYLKNKFLHFGLGRANQMMPTVFSFCLKKIKGFCIYSPCTSIVVALLSLFHKHTEQHIHTYIFRQFHILKHRNVLQQIYLRIRPGWSQHQTTLQSNSDIFFNKPCLEH